MNRDREKRYLEGQRLIVVFWGCALIGFSLTQLTQCARDNTVELEPRMDAATIRREAQRCYDQDLRAILHSDGTIECRPSP